MPRACRFPERLKPRPYQMMLTQLWSLTATPIRGEGDQAQLLLCVKFFADSEFTADERSLIVGRLPQLMAHDEATRALLAPLWSLFIHNSVTF